MDYYKVISDQEATCTYTPYLPDGGPSTEFDTFPLEGANGIYDHWSGLGTFQKGIFSCDGTPFMLIAQEASTDDETNIIVK